MIPLIVLIVPPAAFWWRGQHRASLAPAIMFTLLTFTHTVWAIDRLQQHGWIWVFNLFMAGISAWLAQRCWDDWRRRRKKKPAAAGETGEALVGELQRSLPGCRDAERTGQQ